MLRDNWQAIRDEAVAVALRGEAAPSLATISPDHRSIAEVDKWRSFFLWGYGYPIDDNLARCPRPRALVERDPGAQQRLLLDPGARHPHPRRIAASPRG